MRRKLIFLLGVFVSSLLLMVLMKPFFLIYYHDFTSQCTAGEILKVFFYGLSLDATMSGYITAVPLLVVLISVFFNWSAKRWRQFLLVYFCLVSIFIGLVFSVDLGLYEFWGFRIDGMLLFGYLSDPATAMASVTIGQILRQTLLFLVYGAIMFYTYYRISFLFVSESEKYRIPSILIYLLLGGVLFVDIRGGVTTAVANVSKSYFSTKMYLNHAATNPIFSFLSGLSHPDELNDYNYQKDSEVESKFSIYKGNRVDDSKSKSVLNTSHPNIVLVVMESFSRTIADEKVNGEYVGKNLHRLGENGIWFENFYANSYRTDRGTVAILSSFPGQPNMSLAKDPNKCAKLPGIARTLGKLGYNCSYMYGGDANFTNTAAYLYSVGFNEVIDQKKMHFTNAFVNKWGYADDAVFDMFYKHIEDLQKTDKPYFATLMTLSSHEPFDVPYHKLANIKLNSFSYTDACIGKLVDKLKKSPAWKNMLLIFVADHGYPYPDGLQNVDIRRYHIPMLWMGGAIRQPMVVHTYASQIDIATSVLAQMHQSHTDYLFGKDIFNPTSPEYGYFTFHNGFGVVDSLGYLVYDCNANRVANSNVKDLKKYEMQGKTLLQKTFIEIKKL